MSRTFVMCKPDAVERGLVGEIVGRLEAKGLRIAALELRVADRETAAAHYAEHEGKPFYDDLLSFVTRGPVVPMIVEAPAGAGADAFAIARTLMGATNPAEAAPGSIRGDLAVDRTENLVHGSDSTESADREIGIWFPGR